MRNPWIEAMRLRTLPLSLAGAIVASGCAAATGHFRLEVFMLLIITVLLLQILSNYADEYGDLQKGADNDQRVGPVRAMQRGEISFARMRRAMFILVAATLFSGISLIVVSLGLDLMLLLIFLAMGAFVIFAAIAYTVGRHAYGYLGLGDIFCLICFGWMAVCGGYFLFAHELSIWVWLAATGIGLPVVGVLNVNNMRDRETDAAAGKQTLVVRIGGSAARIYHSCLLLGGVVLLLAAAVGILYGKPSAWLRLIVLLAAAIPLIISLRQTLGVRLLPDYDRCMRPLSLATVLMSLVFVLVAAV